MNKLNKTWFVAALTRALRTIAQTALSMFSVGMALQEVDWLTVLSVSAVAGIYSILTSIITGLPESTIDGEITLPDNEEASEYDLELSIPVEELNNRETITFKVNSKFPSNHF